MSTFIVLHHNYLDNAIPEIRNRIATLPEERDRSWDELNRLFLRTLEEYDVSAE